MKVFVDGKYYDEWNAKVSVFDHGLLYGDGVFEGIRAYNGRVFKLKEHIDRLFYSAKAILLELPMTQQERLNPQVFVATTWEDFMSTAGKSAKRRRADFDPGREKTSGLQHPVQHSHADGSLGLLAGKAARSQPRSDQRLVTTHCRFY